MQMQLFLTTLFVVVLFQVPELFARQTEVKSRTEQRRESHSYLLKEFVLDKKCQWNKEKTQLIQVQLHAGDFVMPSDGYTLPKHTEKVIGLFDLLVLRPLDNIEDIKSVSLLSEGEKELPLKQFAAGSDYLAFYLPRNHPQSPLKISVSAEIEIKLSEIAIRSNRGVDTDFDKQLKRWRTFPKNRFQAVQEAFLLETAKMSFEELNESLNQNSQALRKIIVPARLPSSGPSISLRGILADRRVARIHELLSTLDKNAAGEIAKANFDREFAEFQDVWETGVLVPYQTNHAIESQLFLCSEFCSPATVDGILEKWNKWHEKEQVTKDYQFKTRAAPDFLLTASLQMKMLMRKKGLSLIEANRWVDAVFPEEFRIVGQPKLNQRWLMASDSTPNRPEPIKSIPMFESGDSFIAPGVKQFFLEVLRAELHP